MIINFIDGTGGSGSGYTLPIATSSVLGGVMIGSGITIDASGKISAAAEADLSGLFAGVEYDSSATSINFYDREGTLVGQVDASSFVIDGMIEDVYITGSTMVIEFNTEAGKEDIEIDLTDIFNPANYYTKSQVDAEITAVTNPIQTQVDDMERVTATALTELHDSIIDLSGATEDMATQEWVDDAIETALSGVTSDVLQPANDFPQDAPNGSVVAKPAEGRKIYSWDIDTTEKMHIGIDGAPLIGSYDIYNGQSFFNSDLKVMIHDGEKPSTRVYLGIMTWEEYNAAHPGTVPQDKYRQFPMEYESYWIDYTDPTYPRTDYKVSVYTDGSKVYADVPDAEEWSVYIVGHGSDPEQEYHTETTVFNKGSIYQNVDGTWKNMLSGFTTDEDIETAMAAETARTETAYASKEDFDFISAKTQTNEQVLSAAVVELNDKFSGYTPTSGFATINGSAITEGGNIVIESGSTYILPPATQSTLGGVKVGTYLGMGQGNDLYVDASSIITDYALLSNNVGGPYASQAWVGQQGFATDSDVASDISTAMAAETARTESTYLKEHQSLANYYTKSEVDAELSGITEDIDTLDEVVSQSLVDLEERKVSSTSAKTIVALTQAEYNALATKDPNTLYLING